MKSKQKTYFIITIGCQMNKSDSERLAGYLESQGLKSAEKHERADLVVINTCGVRQSAEDRVYGLVKTIREENPKVKLAITGCLAMREDVMNKFKGQVDVWFPITEIYNLKFLILNQFQISNFKFKISNQCDYLKLGPKLSSVVSAYVPIGNGCNNFCSYCVVPYARGREVWRPAEDILREVRELVERGYKEIVLIAQNVNSYRDDRRQATDDRTVDFAKLLRMVNDTQGEFWIRFATSHPKDMSDELIRTIAACGKVCEHVHLPVQAGDNAVLIRMNRKYTIGHYKKLIKRIRTNKRQMTTNHESGLWQPPVSVTTDVIVGFPGETKKQFENTKKLFKEMKFDQAFIAEYSPRPGTAAAKMDDTVSREEKRRRRVELEKIVKKTSLANNKKYLGKIVEILVKGKNRQGWYYGETRTAKKMLINKITSGIIKPGEFRCVKIISAGEFGLAGEIVK